MAQTKIKLIADGVIDENHLKVGHTITTDNIGEGTNLYYTDARIGSYLSTNSYATEGYVTTAVANLVDAAPSTLDTLNELAAALGDDPNFATTVTNSIATKLPLAGGTLTGNLIVNANVGIGTSSPSSRGFQINKASADSGLVITRTGTGAAEFQQFIDSSGNIRFNNVSSTASIFYTSNTERMRIDSSGNVSFSAGDVSIINTKALRFNGSTDNTCAIGYDSGIDGVKVRGLNGLVFQTGTGAGTERMRITSSGNVGIGTNSPDGIFKAVSGTSPNAAQILIGYNNTSENYFDANTQIFRNGSYAEKMRITSAGNVGIGTSTPAAKFHINAGVVSSPRGGALTKFFLTSDSYTFFELQTPSNETADIIFSDGASGNYGIVGYTHSDDSMHFYTSAQERLRIDSSGNLLVGDTGSGLNSAGRGVIEINGSSSSILGLKVGGTVKTYLFQNGDDVELNNTANGIMVFKTNAAERLRITSSGNIGINMTSPAYKLDVNGQAYFRDLVGVNGEGKGITVDSGYGTNGRVGLMKYPGYEGMLVAGTGTKVRLAHRTDNSSVADASTATIREDFVINSDGTTYIQPSNNSNVLIATGGGNVGIGTSSPTVFSGYTTLAINNSSQGGIVELQSNGTSALRIACSSSDSALWEPRNVPVLFATNNTERIRIDSSGNVGIGATPSTKLDVAGDIHTTVGLRIGSATNGTTGQFLTDGTNTYLDYNGFLSVRRSSSSAESLRIDSSGNVSIGSTGHPDYILEVSNTGGGELSVSTSDSGSGFMYGRITMHSTTAGNGYRNYGGEIRSYAGAGIDYSDLRFYTANGSPSSERMRILSSGGITFNGDTAAANALDDYEEGTFTPVYSSSSGSFATMTMDTGTAKYTKIGNMVTILVYTKTDNVDATGASGSLYLSGLPFTVNGFGGGIALGVSNSFTNQVDGGYFVSGTTLIQLTKSGASTEAQVGDLSTGANNDHNNILFTATYFVS